MNKNQAKAIKSDFVNMNQNYTGNEITSMWNMMVEQLFTDLDKEQSMRNFSNLTREDTIRLLVSPTEDPYNRTNKITIINTIFKTIQQKNNEITNLIRQNNQQGVEINELENKLAEI